MRQQADYAPTSIDGPASQRVGRDIANMTASANSASCGHENDSETENGHRNANTNRYGYGNANANGNGNGNGNGKGDGDVFPSAGPSYGYVLSSDSALRYAVVEAVTGREADDCMLSFWRYRSPPRPPARTASE